MATINHILFPFDFSKPGVLAAKFVRSAAQRFDARVTLLGVIPPVWEVPSAMGVPVVLDSDTDEREAALKARLDAALTEEFHGLTVERATAAGDPALMIAEYAGQHAADLIMMPTHGFGVFRSLLIGSVTAKVLHDAKCPVWTATHAEEQHSRETPRTVLCAVDGTAKTAALAQWAADYSRRVGAALKLLHVVPPLSDWLSLPSERDLQEQAREAARARIEDQLKGTGAADVLPRVAVGQIADTVTEEARQEGADLVIIGRGTLQGPLGRLRTHAYSIIQKSPCPVVSV
jgi:nucleotide-binding universal stress UspA family protein